MTPSTERKLLSESPDAARPDGALLGALLDALSSRLLLVAPDGRILRDFRPREPGSGSRMRDLPPGPSLLDLVHPSDAAACRDWLLRLARQPAGAPAADDLRARPAESSHGGGGALRLHGRNLLAESAVRALLVEVHVDADPSAALAAIHLRDQLAHAEARYQALVELAPGFAYEADVAPDGQVRPRWVSEAFTRILGWTPAELEARGGLRALLHPGDSADAEIQRAAVAAGEQVRCELRLQAKSGDWIWFAALATPLRDPQTGRIHRVLAKLSDISQFKATEARLRDSEERFRVAMDAVSGILYQRDLAAGLVVCSGAVSDVLGYGAEARQATIEWWHERVHPQDRERFRQASRDDGEKVCSSRYRVRHADGHYVELLDRAVRVRDAAGQLLRIVGCAIDVSRERRAERLLHEAEELAHVGSWELDLRTGAMQWSDEIYRIYGVERDRLQPTLDTLLACCVPGSAAMLRAALQRARDAGAGFDLEFEIALPSGRRRWVRATGRTELADSEPVRIVGALQDIDALKRSELRIQEQSDWLRLAMDAAQVLAWRWRPSDDRLLVEYRSPAFLPHVTTGRTLTEQLASVHPEDRARLTAELERTCTTGHPAEFAVRVFDAEGRQRWLASRAIRATGDGGAVVIGATSDITAQRAAEDALRASEALLRSVSENAPDRIVVANAGLEVTFVNRTAGARAADTDLGPVFGLPAGPERDELFGSLRQVLETGRGLRFESQAPRADGTLGTYENRVGPVRHDTRTTGVIVYSTDITERRALEREILEISNREQRRIGSDLHDGLGQELTGIALLLRGITARLERGAPFRSGDLDEVLRLVNGAIDTTRTLARGLSPVALDGGGLADALRALVARTREIYALDIRFRSRLLAPIHLDAAATGHLYRIAQESLTNAARHAGAGVVTVRLAAQPGGLTLTVSDDGRGFQPGPAGGMGLKIMRYRAHMLGGELRIEPGSDGRGTRIVCTVAQDAATGMPHFG